MLSKKKPGVLAGDVAPRISRSPWFWRFHRFWCGREHGAGTGAPDRVPSKRSGVPRCTHTPQAGACTRTQHTHVIQWSRTPSTRIDRLVPTMVPTRCLVTTGREGHRFASQAFGGCARSDPCANQRAIDTAANAAVPATAAAANGVGARCACWIQSCTKRSPPETTAGPTHTFESLSI